MARIDLTTEIAAPPQLCFDLSRDVDFHASVAALRHRPVAGVTSGRLEVGESVTWEARQFGLLMHMTSKIVAMEPPNGFTDEMQKGPFGRWRHSHTFTDSPRGTLMRDVIDFASPLGPLGALVDRLYMRRHMERFLVGLNAQLQLTAERRA